MITEAHWSSKTRCYLTSLDPGRNDVIDLSWYCHCQLLIKMVVMDAMRKWQLWWSHILMNGMKTARRFQHCFKQLFVCWSKYIVELYNSHQTRMRYMKRNITWAPVYWLLVLCRHEKCGTHWQSKALLYCYKKSWLLSVTELRCEPAKCIQSEEVSGHMACPCCLVWFKAADVLHYWHGFEEYPPWIIYKKELEMIRNLAKVAHLEKTNK